MKAKTTAIFIASIFLVAISAYSQGGSSYSIFGLGDLLGTVTATSDGLAGTSIAMPSEHNINTKNPALWSKVLTTRLQAGYHFNQNIVQNSQFSLYQNNGKVSGILGIFAVDTTTGLGISFGIHPYSSVNYYLKTPINISLDGETITGATTYQGLGGMSIGYIGAGVGITKDLSVGAEIFGSFGYINSMSGTEIFDGSSYPSKNGNSDNIYGYGFKAGLFYNLFDGFSLGAFTEIHNSLSIDRTTTYYSYSISDSSFSETLSLKVPMNFGFGLSYQTGKFLIGADYSTQDFSNFSYQKDTKTNFKNNTNFSFGVSRFGNKSYSASTLDKITYNLGFCSKQLYYEINGQSISEMFGSLGVEIPIVSGAMLNAGIQIGTRGTTNSGLVKENFGRLTVDISIGETWFKPFKREY